MSFVSDKLYNGYVRRKMKTLVNNVDVGEIIVHLPCLTSHDRETIEARRQNLGKSEGMVLLLDCLKRRENWPEQLIEALEACEHATLAAEIREEYNKLNGTNKSAPNSPAAVAPPAVASTPPQPAVASAPPQLAAASAPTQPAVASAPTQPAVASAPPQPVVASAPPEPAVASAPLQPAAQASPTLETPVQPQAPPSSAAKVPEVVSPPEPVSEPPQPIQNEVAPPPSTPPPSPATQHTRATATPPPQREINSHLEPEENSESDIQDYSGDSGVIPDQVSARNRETPPQDSGPVEQCETDAASRPDPLQKTTTDTTRFSPPQSPSLTQVNSDVTDGSSVLLKTPERPPVQDTTPHVGIKPAAVLQPEETSEPPAAQVVESSPQTATAAVTSTLPGAAEMVSFCTDSSVCLSKPGQLLSILPQNNGGPNIHAPSSPQQPYSGNSERLEISDAEPDAVTSAHLPACSAVCSTTVTTASALPCQENGIALHHNEPEENHYESTSQVLEVPEVLEYVLHVSEEPSILNLDGQSSTPQAQIVNGEAAKVIPSAPPLSNDVTDTVSSVEALSSENLHPSEPAAAELKTLQDSQEKTASRTLPTNTKYILTAAGVGACALLMAWRFKN